MRRKRHPCTRHEVICKSGSISPLILNLGARLGECLASRLGRFAQRGNSFRCSISGGWVGPRAGLEVLELQLKLLRLPGIEPLFWVFQPVSQSLYQPSYSGPFVNISTIQLLKIFIFVFNEILVVKFLMKVKKILNNK